MFDALTEVTPGQRIEVRFKSEATEDLVYVIAMERAQVLKLSPGDMALVHAVQLTGDWEEEGNRTFVFEAGPSWSKDFFVGRMRRALEHCAVLN